MATTRVQELDAEPKEIKRDRETLEASLSELQLALKSMENRLEEDQMWSFAPVLEIKLEEQK